MAYGRPFPCHPESCNFLAGLCPKHIQSTISQTPRVFQACQFTNWPDVDCKSVHESLIDLRDGGQGISKRTFNVYVQSLKAFCQWVVDTHERLDRSPLEKLKRLPKIQTVRRLARHASISTTMRYFHGRQKEQRAAVENLPNLAIPQAGATGRKLASAAATTHGLWIDC